MAPSTMARFSTWRSSSGHDFKCLRTLRGHGRHIQQRGTVRISVVRPIQCFHDARSFETSEMERFRRFFF